MNYEQTWRHLLSVFTFSFATSYCHCCQWSHIACLWLTVWRTILALLCLDITRKHEKYSSKAVSIKKLKFQGLIREVPSNWLLNKANFQGNEEKRCPKSTLKEWLGIDKNKVSTMFWSVFTKKLYKNIWQLRQRSWGGLKWTADFGLDTTLYTPQLSYRVPFSTYSCSLPYLVKPRFFL